MLFGVSLSVPPPHPIEKPTIPVPKSSGLNGASWAGELTSWLSSPAEFWVAPAHTVCITQLHAVLRLHLKFKHIPPRIEKAWGREVTLPSKRHVSTVHLVFYFCFWIKDRMLIKSERLIFWAVINLCAALLSSVESLNFWKHKGWKIFPRGLSNVPFHLIVLIFPLRVDLKQNQCYEKKCHTGVPVPYDH